MGGDGGVGVVGYGGLLNTIGFNMAVLWWWGGEWSPSHFRLKQHHDGVVRLVRETSVFVKAHHRRFGGCGCSGYGGLDVGRWAVMVVWVWSGRVGC